MSKKQTNRGDSAKGGAPSPVKMPSKENVLDWVRKDLEAARALLTVVLNRHPEIVEEMADNMYETILRKEQGPAINHVTNPPPGAAETGLD